MTFSGRFLNMVQYIPQYREYKGEEVRGKKSEGRECENELVTVCSLGLGLSPDEMETLVF